MSFQVDIALLVTVQGKFFGFAVDKTLNGSRETL